MASLVWRVRQRKWYSYFYVGPTKKGRPLQRAPRKKKLNKQERKLAEIEAFEIEQDHQLIREDELDVESAGAHWLADCKVGLSDSTYSAYRSRMKLFVKAVADNRMPLSEVTPHTVRTWRDIRMDSVGTNTVRNDIKAIQSFFSWCVKEGLLEKNPAQQVRIPKKQKVERTIPTTEDIARMFKLLSADGIDPAYRGLGYMGALCGMRRGEIIALRWIDINLEDRFIRIEISKSKHSRNVPMPDRVYQLLMDIPQGKDLYIYPRIRQRKNKAGNISPHRGKKVGVNFNSWLKDNGFYFTHHGLRHWFNDELRKQGLDSMSRLHIVGHTDESVNAIYCHPQAEEARPFMGALESHLNDLLSQ